MRLLFRICAVMCGLLLAYSCAAAEEDMLLVHIEQVYAAVSQQESEDQVEIFHEITHESQRYASVVFRQRFSGGNGMYEHIWADTLASDGVYRGSELTLSTLLGMETDEMESPAARLVYELIWQIVEPECQGPESDYLDGLTIDDLEKAFDSERDFYLDETGNLVFFIQPGGIASEVAGTLLFPFSPAEILSTVNP